MVAGQIIKRSKNSFTVRVFLGRDANTGKRKYHNQTVHGNKKEAEKVLTALQRKRDLGQLLLEPTRMTVEEYLDHWLEVGAKPGLAENTFEKYEWMMNNYVVPVVGQRRLPKLTTVEVQGVYSGLLNRGLSARSVRYCHTVFNKAMNQAVKWRMIPHNPAQYVELPKQHRKEMLALSQEEANIFLDTANGTKHYVLFATLLGTGLRPSEAYGLQWGDFEFAEGVLFLKRSLIRSSSGWRFGPTKGGRGRRIDLPQHLCQLLLGHKEQQASNPHALVFANREGNPLDHHNVYHRHFKKLVRKAKLPEKLRMYDLRHTHATLLLIAGVHPKIVSERLGHASVQITLDIYSHVLPGMQQESARMLNELLFTSTAGSSVAPLLN